MAITVEDALSSAGTGRFQRRLLGIFGLVWAADAMQVLAVGFTGASIAETFGISVPEALQTGTLFFLGMLIGAAGFGRLADRIGRRNVLIVTVACDALFGLLSVFAPSFAILLGLRFLTGIAVGGTLPVDYAMMAEFLPAKNRGRWLVMLEGFWALGTVIVALAAWIAASLLVVDAWRWIFVVTALPALIGIGLRFSVPESPLYLLRAGREPEARAVVDKVLRTNGKPTLAAGTTLAAPAATKSSLFSPDLRRQTMHDPRRLVPGLDLLLRRLHLAARQARRRTVSASCAAMASCCWWRSPSCPATRLPPMASNAGAAARR